MPQKKIIYGNTFVKITSKFIRIMIPKFKKIIRGSEQYFSNWINFVFEQNFLEFYNNF